MKQAVSYLKQLRFDKKLENSLLSKYLHNPRLLILILTSVITVGLFSYINLPRRLNPEIKIPIVIVNTVLPGASPNDVENLITVPVEDAVSGIDKVKSISSQSRESVSTTQIEFLSGTDPDKAKTDVQSAIDTISLPEESLDPQVLKLDFENQPVWTFTLSSSDVPSLMKVSSFLKDTLKDKPNIDRVETSGLEEQEVQVVLKPEIISEYGINPFQISSLIKLSLSSYPAGYVKSDNLTYTISIDKEIVSIEDIRNTPISIQGIPVKLGSIAEVSLRSKPDQKLSFISTEKSAKSQSVTFYVYKTDNSNIDKAAKEAETTVDEELKPYGDQFEIKTISNTAHEIEDQFNELLRDFAITSILIVIVLFIFLGLRQAIVAAFSVPLTFLITFFVMNLTGISLNFLSMFSLLLALGLLVDDTIVVISAMTAYYRTGRFTPLQTGLLVWRDFFVAIFTTTITTVWAFLPLLLSTGIIGEFIKSIPIVVSSTLLASLVVAMGITMPVIIVLLKPSIPGRVKTFLKVLSIVVLLGILFAILPKGALLPLEILAVLVFLFVTQTVRLALVKKTGEKYKNLQRTNKTVKNLPSYVDNGIFHFDRISSKYHSLIYKILASKKNRRMAIVMVIIFSIFSYTLLPLGFVKNEFFPKSDNDYIYISLELPSGTNVQTTQNEALKVAEVIRRTPFSLFTTTEIGRGLNQESGNSQGGESNTALITLRLEETSKRSVSSIEIAQNLRDKFSMYEKGKISVVEISGGPPAGSDLQIKLYGEDLKSLNEYAVRIEDFLKSHEGVTNINLSIKPGTSKIVFSPNLEQITKNKITIDQIGGTLRLFASGFSPDTIKLPNEGTDEKDITIRLDNKIKSPEDLSNILITSTDGKSYPLLSLGELNLASNPTLITREDGKRTISVSAAVETAQGYSVSELNKKLEDFAEKSLNLPEGYTWETGGVNEENQNSVSSILQAMLLSFLLIILTMVLQFSSFRKALIVMLVIPLSISGVFIIFALTKTPLSFPALIGVLALFGIVVKNSILVVDKIKQNEEAGLPFIDSVADGASSRLEAIALTSMTAIIGLIPITLSDPLWRGLGGAIIAGLTFSGTIMLFFIPIVYYNWFAPKK